MRTTSTAALLLTVLLPTLGSAQVRVRAGGSQDITITLTTPGANFIAGSCSISAFTPTRTPRPTNPAATRTAVARAKPCQHPGAGITVTGASVNYGVFLGEFVSSSIMDVGRYTVRCTTSSNIIYASDYGHMYSACSRGTAANQGCGETEWCPVEWLGANPPNEFSFEVENAPPTLAVTQSGTGLLGGNRVGARARVVLASGAADADPGTVTVTWRVTRPSTATAATSSFPDATGPTRTLQFNGEADFGVWNIEVIADDAQGERVTATHTIEVVNQLPAPTLTAAAARVRVGSPVDLTVTADDDGGAYSSVRWQAIAPGGGDTFVDVGPSGAALMFSMPTTRMSLGTWRFRAVVTDADAPPLTGNSNELSVEVFNDPPVLMVIPAYDVVPLGSTLTLQATATDPDLGPVRVQWILVQAPSAAGASLGVPLGSATAVETAGPRTFAVPLTVPGTWVFRAVATDDEGDSVRSDRIAFTADAPPTAVIRQAPSVTVGPGRFDLNDESIDPDSHCANALDPNRCHHVAMGETFLALSGGIRSRAWSVESVPSAWAHRYPIGPVAAAFHVPDGLQVLHFEPGEIEPGTYRFRLDVVDSETTRVGSTTITVQVLPPQLPPIAHVAMPARYLADATGRLMTSVTLNGSLSFDLDNAISFTPPPGVGITGYAWTVLPPAGCPLAPTPAPVPVSTLFAAGTVLPTSCFGVWTIRLTVADDDTPQLFGFRDVDIVLGTCGTGVCFDRPTQARPQLVDPGMPIAVPIYFYVDASIYARPEYEYGFYAYIDIIPAGSSVPIYTITDTTASGRAGALTTVTWHGETATPGVTAGSGTYDLRLRIADISRIPGPQITELNAVLIESVTVSIDAATATRYARHQDIEASPAYFAYTVNGAFGVTQVRTLIKRVGVGVAFDVTADTTATTGALFWNGRSTGGTGPLLPPGEYDLEVSAHRTGRLLARSSPFRFTVYRLGLGPVASTDPLRLGLNTDDDNFDGTVDATQLGVTGENDLVQLEVRAEPATLAGQLRVTLPSSGGLRMFTTATKMAEVPSGSETARPATALPVLWLEGRTPGSHDVVLRFTPTGAPALTDETRRVSVVGLEVLADTDGTPGLSPADAPATSLVPGLWDNGHTSTGAGTLDFDANVAAGSSFVDTDPKHFFIRLSDASANRDPGTIETTTVRIGTLLDFPVPAGGAEVFADPLSEVPVVETGIDTGIFVSEAQLLTSNDDAQGPNDDEVPVGAIGGTRFDEELGDRTHRIGAPGHSLLSGGVRVSYMSSSAALAATVPVCGRGPDARQAIVIRPISILEPYMDLNADGAFTFTNSNTSTDVGGVGVHDPEEDSEPYVDLSTGGMSMIAGGPMSAAMGRSGRGSAGSEALFDEQIARAQSALAPSCFEVRRVPAPMKVLTTNLNGILSDGILDLFTGFTAAEEDVLFNAIDSSPLVGPTLTTRIDVVMGTPDITSPWGHALAYTLVPSVFPSYGGKVDIFLRNNLINRRILAHELAHALTNTTDTANPQWQFFPAATTHPDTLLRYRRYPQLVDTQMKTTRASVSVPGNTLRSAY